MLIYLLMISLFLNLIKKEYKVHVSYESADQSYCKGSIWETWQWIVKSKFEANSHGYHE